MHKMVLNVITALHRKFSAKAKNTNKANWDPIAFNHAVSKIMQSTASISTSGNFVHATVILGVLGPYRGTQSHLNPALY